MKYFLCKSPSLVPRWLYHRLFSPFNGSKTPSKPLFSKFCKSLL